MARAGYEADRQVLQVRDLATGQVRALTANWDRSVGSIAWAKDGKSRSWSPPRTRWKRRCSASMSPRGKVTRLTGDGHAGNVRAAGRRRRALSPRTASWRPTTCIASTPAGKVAQLTNVNRDLLAELDPVTLREIQLHRRQQRQGLGLQAQAAGPQCRAASCRSPSSSMAGRRAASAMAGPTAGTRALFASPGYAVVSVDFHGSTGYGQAFTDSIRNNWGGWPLEDLQKGLAFATAQDAAARRRQCLRARAPATAAT